MGRKETDSKQARAPHITHQVVIGLGRKLSRVKEKSMQGAAAVGVCVLSCSVTSNSLRPHGLCPWDFPGKNTRVRCHFLLQGIFLTQGSNLWFLHWQTDSLTLCHLGSPMAWNAVYLFLKTLLYTSLLSGSFSRGPFLGWQGT